MYHIARNVLVDHYRKNKVVRMPLLPGEENITSADVSPAWEGEELRNKLSCCLRPFVEDLSEPYKSALIWTTYEGLNQAEAAHRAGVSLSGMKSRVQRGRKQVARKFMSCCALQFDARGTPIACNC